MRNTTAIALSATACLVGLASGLALHCPLALTTPPSPLGATASATDPHGISEIRLERVADGLGVPIEVLIFRSDNSATYYGYRSVARIGRYNGHYPFSEVATLIAAQHLERLPEKISCGFDGVTESVAVVRYGHERRVSAYTCDDLSKAPAFFTVVLTLQGLRDRIQWHKESGA